MPKLNWERRFRNVGMPIDRRSDEMRFAEGELARAAKSLEEEREKERRSSGGAIPSFERCPTTAAGVRCELRQDHSGPHHALTRGTGRKSWVD
jgi:hypothetical protein